MEHLKCVLDFSQHTPSTQKLLEKLNSEIAIMHAYKHAKTFPAAAIQESIDSMMIIRSETFFFHRISQN